LGVVPEATSEWNPEMAPQAIVMNTKGKSLPGTMGPPPSTKAEKAGAWMVGATTMVDTTSATIVPSFM
jgi:hypothetical protein